MKTVYILRHAHAGERETALADFDRPLNDQGRREAQAVANYFQDHNITVDLVLCSAALRTQETLEPLRPLLKTTSIEISEAFYNAPETRIFQSLRAVEDDKSSLLYICHNPGVAFAILKLAQIFPSVLTDGVKPATLVELSFPIETWEELDWRTGEVKAVFQPSLPEEESPESKGS